MSAAQQMQALAKGNAIRMKRAEYKRELRAIGCKSDSRRRCGELILENPPVLDRMMALDLIAACRGTGHVLAEKMLTRLRITPTRGIGGLTDRQREQLAGELGATTPVVLVADVRFSGRPADYCPRCEESTALHESGRCPFCSSRLRQAA